MATSKRIARLVRLFTILTCCVHFVYTGHPPKIRKSGDKQYKRNVGDHVKLRCQATGAQDDSNNRTLFFWKNQFGLIRQDRIRWPRYEIKQNKYLKISNIKPEDAGVYTCTATNEFGYHDANRTLRVLKNGKEVEPVKPSKWRRPVRKRPVPPAVEFMKGTELAPKILVHKNESPRRVHMVRESTKLKCLVNNADPPPIITWTKDNKSLQMGAKMRYIHGHKFLHFRSLSIGDSGNYTCIVANKLGTDSYTFELIVKPQLERKLTNLALTQRTIAYVSKNFTLTCKTSAKRKGSMPRFRWMKYTSSGHAQTYKLERTFKAPVASVNLINPKKSKKFSRMIWRFDYDKNGSLLVSLTFLNVTYKDVGFYECKNGSSRSAKIIESILVVVKEKVVAEDNTVEDADKTDTGKKMTEEENEREEGIPLLLMITVPTVAGVICLTVVLIFWRMHKKKEKMAKRSRPDAVKMTELELQQPLRNGHFVKTTKNGSLSHNGSLLQNGSLPHNGTLCHNGTSAKNGLCPHKSLSYNGSMNSLRNGVQRTNNGAALTVVYHDPILGTKLECIKKESSTTNVT